MYRTESHSAALALTSHCSRHYTTRHPCVNTNVSLRATPDVCVRVCVCACVRVCVCACAAGLASSNFMSKSYSGSRSLLDPRHQPGQQTSQAMQSPVPGSNKGKGSSAPGQFGNLKQQPKMRRGDKVSGWV
jgi:hypothetical protein